METKPQFSGIQWLLTARLGGCARPDSEAALDMLQSAGVTQLISLTDEWQPDLAPIKQRNIEPLYVPIVDFTPPSHQQALTVCQAIEAGSITVLHCAAGKGRTGTLLAAYLIYQGLGADEAIKKTRGVNPDWIETTSQIEFLKQFAQSI